MRKTVHLVAPGWNAFGAGEPALPGIALGHNDRLAFGFTIVGIDQADLYVEKVNPNSPDEYFYQGSWRKFQDRTRQLDVKGRSQPVTIQLRYTVHGPVIYADPTRQRAYALRWVGSEPGSAGYLAGLSLMRARNWNEFRSGLERYKVPSENLVYADLDGNIGWQAGGLAPIRKNWTGLFPVPGDTGEYEWTGFREAKDLPFSFNPREHFIATANHNILPPGYNVPLGYEWALPFRFERIKEMLSSGRKFTVADFERMQQDVTSLPARRFQAIVRNWKAPEAMGSVVKQVTSWDGVLSVDSAAAAIYEFWIAALPASLFGSELGSRVDIQTTLEQLERKPDSKVLASSLEVALAELEKRLGTDRRSWSWGRLHRVIFPHPVRGVPGAGEFARPGDANTVNATSGPRFQQTAGASYRQIIDLSNWDKSMMTNTPGESGDPRSPHYSDLAVSWAEGRYHPMPFSRAAVEEATTQRLMLLPAQRYAKVTFGMRRKKVGSYIASIPERLVRSITGLTAGALREIGDVVLPPRVRRSRLYDSIVDSTLRFLIEQVGQIETANNSVPLPGDFLMRRTAGNVFELAGIAAFRASPVWVLAALSDLAGASKELIAEISDALQKDGLLPPGRSFGSVSELLDGLESTAAKLAETVNTPPLDVAGLREEWDKLQAEASRLPRAALPDVRRLYDQWRELNEAARQGRSVLELSSVMAIAAVRSLPENARWLSRAARSGGLRTGEVLARGLLDDYRAP